MKILKKLLIAIIAISVLLSVFSIGALAAEPYAYGAATISTTNLNLRSGPGKTFSVITTLNLGDIVVKIGRAHV